MFSKGSFGIVYELVKKTTKEKYAVKIISKEKVIHAYSSMNFAFY